jgi:hypothetical protein
MIICELCGNEFDEWCFTNETKACDYCYAMWGLGYGLKPLSTFMDNNSNKKGLFD